MRRSLITRLFVLLALAAAALAAPTRAEEGAAPAKKIRLLVVTGGHGYNEKEFPKIFEGNPDLEVTYLRQKEGGEAFANIDKWAYDAVLLYNFNQKIAAAEQANFLKLLDKGVGLIVLHHAMAAYPDWPQFKDVAGAKFYLKPTQEPDGLHPQSGVSFGDFKVHPASAGHPITKGLADFTIHDEAYNKYWVDPKAEVLLTTDSPGSDKVLAWARTFGKARVFGMQLGHDEKAWAVPEYRTVLVRAVRWTAGQ